LVFDLTATNVSKSYEKTRVLEGIFKGHKGHLALWGAATNSAEALYT
jgi:hypothetical protein